MKGEKVYEKLMLELILFSSEDIITMSDSNEAFDNGENDLDWSGRFQQ